MNPILETPRLTLREMTQSDLPALCRMLQDEEVMYAYPPPFLTGKRRNGRTAGLPGTASACGRRSKRPPGSRWASAA